MLLSGTTVAAQVCARIRSEIASSGNKPVLAIILIGDHAPSRRYVTRKMERAAELGIGTKLFEYPADVTEDRILSKIAAVNADPGIHGLIVQLPLPLQIDRQKVIETIDPAKDVDGFHPLNVGRMFVGEPSLTCATPTGVIRLLDHYGIPVEGKHAVVVGRSNIVGKPMALMLINRGATVTSCNSKTPDLASITRQADILISATGRARGIKADMVQEGAVVIDIGQSFIDDELFGDVDFEPVSAKASAITPTPGGVGPMTIAMLLENTWKAFKMS